MQQETHTPLMAQYFAIRQEYPDTLLFFQVGDFYELFFEDAKTAASFLALTLTKRGKLGGEPIPLCGVPVHALSHYLQKLVRGGFKVAICEQVGKAVPGTVVARKVTRVFTPGTLTELSMLDTRTASYLCALWPGRSHWGLIFTELLSSRSFSTIIPTGGYRTLEAELVRFLPDEVVLPRLKAADPFARYFAQQGYAVSLADLAAVDPQAVFDAHDGKLNDDWASTPAVTQWTTQNLAPSLCAQVASHPALASVTGLLGTYLKKTNAAALQNFTSVTLYQPDDYLVVDAATQRNLEIVKNSQDGSRTNTLLSVLDQARTPMGSRMIRSWLLRPLVDRAALEARLSVVGLLAEQVTVRHHLSDLLARLADLERITGRIALDRAIPADFLALKQTLEHLPEIREVAHSLKTAPLGERLVGEISPLPTLHELLEASISEIDGLVIKPGFDYELDELRELSQSSEQAILRMEAAEIAATGIASLKIRYTDAFGYGIEITKTHEASVPAHYQPHQTLVGRTRYVTAELKELERAITSARERIDVVQAAVFSRVKLEVSSFVGTLRRTAHALAALDSFVSFATVSSDQGFVRPEFTSERDIVISRGRHPVVERVCNGQFVPNDTALTDAASLHIVTGPNMGGKSTYLRQVALICYLAQCGSFVPATRALVPLLDRIFTRIGSGDNLAAGKSTFLVEMEESALICRQATARSLVILDEVGRGTSTFDGMAIAQAIIEYLFEVVKVRCLFATHYHELTALGAHHPGIANLFLRCRRTSGGIVFLHEVAPGVAQGSFGVDVAELADLPSPVVARARQLLAMLPTHPEGFPKEIVSKGQPVHQASPVAPEDRPATAELEQLRHLATRLRTIDPDDFSPREAHELLRRLHIELGKC